MHVRQGTKPRHLRKKPRTKVFFHVSTAEAMGPSGAGNFGPNLRRDPDRTPHVKLSVPAINSKKSTEDQ